MFLILPRLLTISLRTVDTGLYRPAEYSLDEYIRCTAWFQEAQIIRMQGSVDTYITITDMSGFSVWRNDMKKAFESTFIAQTCYPGRLSLSILINVPTTFTAIWTVMKGWMDPEMLSKIHLFGKSESQKAAARSLLQDLVSPEELLEQYGGARTELYPIPTAKPVKGDDYPGAKR